MKEQFFLWIVFKEQHEIFQKVVGSVENQSEEPDGNSF